MQLKIIKILQVAGSVGLRCPAPYFGIIIIGYLIIFFIISFASKGRKYLTVSIFPLK